MHGNMKLTPLSLDSPNLQKDEADAGAAGGAGGAVLDVEPAKAKGSAKAKAAKPKIGAGNPAS